MDKLNPKNIFIGIGAVIATFIFLFVVYKLTNTPIQTDFPEINVIRTQDHVKWNPKSKNILVEYSDLECPACNALHSFLNELEKTTTPNAQLVFRYFPLYQIHPEAFNAAYAAESASHQGKFWKMAELLFDSQDSWSKLGDPTSYFVDLAKKLGLDLNKFKADMTSQAVKDRIQSDLSEGEKIGINSTPTLFLNGKRVTVNGNDELKKLLLSL